MLSLLFSIITTPVKWYFAKMEQFGESKDTGKMITYFLVSLLGLFIFVFAFFFIIDWILKEHIEVAICLFIIWFIYDYYYTRMIQNSQQVQQVQPVPQPELEEMQELQFDTIMLENTYKLLRTALCTVISEVADLIGVKKVMSPSQMDAPIHYDIMANVVIYHFLLSKNIEIDTYEILGILQNSFERKLMNNEISGFSQPVYLYHSQAYPYIMVDKVFSNGNLVQVDICIANENYCRHREKRIYNNMINSTASDIKDREF